MNVREVIVKMARKEGRPNSGSDERAVTLTAALEAGEDHRIAAQQLRAEATAILAGLWHPAAEAPSLAQRVTEPSSRVAPVPSPSGVRIDDHKPTGQVLQEPSGGVQSTGFTGILHREPAATASSAKVALNRIAVSNTAIRQGAILTPTTRNLIEAAIHDLKSLTTRPFDERIPYTEEEGRAMARKLRASAHDLRKTL